MKYVAGKSSEALQRELGVRDIVKLGSNENPLGPSPLAVASVIECAPRSHLYPGVEPLDLRTAIAASNGLTAAHVVIGNGSSDILTGLAATVLSPSDEAVIPQPSFAMYQIGAEAAGAKVVVVAHRDYAFDLSGIRSAVTPRTRMVFLTNPNNPTGLALSRAELTGLLDDLPGDVLTVIDEAYGEYVDPELHVDGVDYLREGRNVVITRTFSKIYGLAGLRVGYGLAATDLADRLIAAQGPFRTGALQLRAAQAALADRDHLERSWDLNRQGRDFLTRELGAVGLRVLPSQANHVLIVGLSDVEMIDAALNAQGIIARPTGPSFGLEGGLRVTVGTAEQNRLFLEALRAAISGHGIVT